MKKILHVALREFQSTVLTKGFIIGVLVTPVLISFMVIVMPMLMNEEPPRIDGDVAVLDPTGNQLGLRQCSQRDAGKGHVDTRA